MKKILTTEMIQYKNKLFYIVGDHGEMQGVAHLFYRIKPMPVVSITTEFYKNGSSGNWFKIQGINAGGWFMTPRQIKWMKIAIADFYNCFANSIFLITGKEISLQELLTYIN